MMFRQHTIELGQLMAKQSVTLVYGGGNVGLMGIIADEVMNEGTVDHAPVYPREVARRALELSAVAVILVHNHPTDRISITADHALSH